MGYSVGYLCACRLFFMVVHKVFVCFNGRVAYPVPYPPPEEGRHRAGLSLCVFGSFDTAPEEGRLPAGLSPDWNLGYWVESLVV